MRALTARTSVVALALAVVAGCGSSSGDEPAPKATTTAAPQTYTIEQARAALPSLEQIPDAEEYLLRCPGGDGCPKGSSNGVVAAKVKSATPAAGEVADAYTLDIVNINVVVQDDGTEITKAQTRSRKGDEVYDGAYDIGEKKVETGTVPPEKGTGTVADFESGAFTGYRVDRVQEFRLDGGLQLSYINVVSGNLLVTVQTRLAGEGRAAGTSGTIAEDLLDDVLERLAS